MVPDPKKPGRNAIILMLCIPQAAMKDFMMSVGYDEIVPRSRVVSTNRPVMRNPDSFSWNALEMVVALDYIITLPATAPPKLRL